MPRLSPQEIAAKAASRAAAASADYEAGVRRVSVAPGQRAAAKKNAYVQNTAASADKWASRTAAVSLADWQNATLGKSGRFAQGVSAAQPKIAEFWTSFGPHLDNVTAKVRAMPSDTMEQRIERARQQMLGAAAYKR